MPSLLWACQGRHPQVEVTVDDDPLPLVEFLLSAECVSQVAVGLVLREVVHGHEVLEQRRATGRISDKADVLCLVARPAEGLEAGEPLIAGGGLQYQTSWHSSRSCLPQAWHLWEARL